MVQIIQKIYGTFKSVGINAKIKMNSIKNKVVTRVNITKESIVTLLPQRRLPMSDDEIKEAKQAVIDYILTYEVPENCTLFSADDIEFVEVCKTRDGVLMNIIFNESQFYYLGQNMSTSLDKIQIYSLES
jgi:hypothetical protein